jgi:hypothetical protein
LARFGVFKQKKIPPRDFGPFFPPQKTPFYDEQHLAFFFGGRMQNFANKKKQSSLVT